jgi:predicted DCC family thiol-disulfide oxidoreductase YuxK
MSATTLVYDGDCGFCTTSIRWVKRLRLRADSVVAWQHADLEALGLTPEQCDLKLQWVADDGAISSGHEAVAQLLRHSAPPWRPVGMLLLTPPLSWLAARAYAWVSANRQRLPGGTPACALAPEQRPNGT